jgi:hypothetical protein
MSRVLGVACDKCGTLDVELNPDSFSVEDMFPRNGWISLNEWGEDGVVGPIEIHICSLKCLAEFSAEALANEHTHEEGEDHHHHE